MNDPLISERLYALEKRLNSLETSVNRTLSSLLDTRESQLKLNDSNLKTFTMIVSAIQSLRGMVDVADELLPENPEHE